MFTNRNKRTARRALVARLESLEGRISLTGITLPGKPPAVTTITLIHSTNTPIFLNSGFHFG